MHAVILTGGKQYRVRPGDELCIERLEAAKGPTLRLENVLLCSSEEDTVKIGQPTVKGAYCEAQVLGEVKGPKVISFKYIRREKSATKKGHRQKYLKIKIKSIHHGA